MVFVHMVFVHTVFARMVLARMVFVHTVLARMVFVHTVLARMVFVHMVFVHTVLARMVFARMVLVHRHCKATVHRAKHPYQLAAITATPTREIQRCRTNTTGTQWPAPITNTHRHTEGSEWWPLQLAAHCAPARVASPRRQPSFQCCSFARLLCHWQRPPHRGLC